MVREHRQLCHCSHVSGHQTLRMRLQSYINLLCVGEEEATTVLV